MLLHWLLIALCAGIMIVSAVLVVLNRPYLGWDFSDRELAVAGTAFYVFEWLFARLAPIVLIAAIVGVCLTQKKYESLKSAQNPNCVVLFSPCIPYDHISSCKEWIMRGEQHHEHG